MIFIGHPTPDNSPVIYTTVVTGSRSRLHSGHEIDPPLVIGLAALRMGHVWHDKHVIAHNMINMSYLMI